ncbi:MAG: hypothetical protein B6U69_03785 [Thermofilum sp. ex4484_15]|nr:MAG: hypothetical protein B6U69_03785 [Thermofilum sp. ex4484_15]
MPRKSLDGLRKKLLKSREEKVRKGDKLLREYVERIVKEYPESTVILFGSRARSKALKISCLL